MKVSACFSARLFHVERPIRARAAIALIGLLMTFGQARADQIDYTLHLVVHDYGKLVASGRACKRDVDETRLRDSVLEVVSTDPDLDEDDTSRSMNRSIEKRVLGTIGCSNASITIAQQHLNRDLINLRYAISVAH